MQVESLAAECLGLFRGGLAGGMWQQHLRDSLPCQLSQQGPHLCQEQAQP